MSKVTVIESAIIHATPAAVYALIRDYEVGHPAILPKPYFKEIIVEEGGQGAGTVFHMTMVLFGREYKSLVEVTEPEPGRVLKEADRLSDQETVFIIEPAPNNETKLTFETSLSVPKGIIGVIQRILIPRTLRPIYVKEFANINAYLAAQ